ncbi:MAG: DUF3011 domain-containing protein [Pseudoxanthomonas sp.]
MKIVLKGFAASLLVACSASALGEPPTTDEGEGMRFRCETDSSQQRYCKVDTSDGITLVKQLSKIPCMQGRNWDYDRHGVWVSHRCGGEFVTGKQAYQPPRQGPLVRCESQANRIEHCTADTHDGVRLVRQLSTSDCVENLDWGHDDKGIWVARGCRAEFRIGVDEAASGQVDAENAGITKISCESTDRQRQRCDIAVKTGVDLFRQISKTRCVRDRSWGWDSDGIWVDHGCRAEFSVR